MGLDKHTITCVYHCSIIQGIFTVGGLSSYSRKMVSRSSKDLERDDRSGVLASSAVWPVTCGATLENSHPCWGLVFLNVNGSVGPDAL